MNDLDAIELERRVHEALAGLPVRRAPASLRPRVMAAARARARRPWYARTWSAWPLPARAAAALVAAVIVVASVWWVPAGASDASGTVSLVVGRVVSRLGAALPDDVQRAITFAGVARVVWRTVLGPALFYVAIISVVVGGVFVSCAALVTRIALGRAVA